MVTSNETGKTIFPVTVVKVNGVTCRALIDSGSSSSYVSAKVAAMFGTKPLRTVNTTIEMLMNEKRVNLPTYKGNIVSMRDDFSMNVELMQVQREVLLYTDNPCYKQLARKCPHLQEAVMDDDDTKSKLPIHLVLGGGEFARIKPPTCPLVGKEGEPVAELTRLGWVIMSPGQQLCQNRMLFTQTTHKDYEELCRLDVLGLPDRSEHDQAYIHAEFKEQLSRGESGFYETSLPWLGNHPPLPDNKAGSRAKAQATRA